MVEQDTIRLLRECDAGVKMGISSIGEVLSHVKDADLKQNLAETKRDHEILEQDLRTMLNRYEDGGKEPNPMAKGMSWLKTNMMMSVNHSDETIADLIYEGCSMGVKSLSRYLNKYEAAEEKTKDIAKKLISMEDKLATQMRAYL